MASRTHWHPSNLISVVHSPSLSPSPSLSLSSLSLSSKMSDVQTVTTTVPDDKIGLVIGRGGAGLTRIRQETEVKVRSMCFGFHLINSERCLFVDG